jgi:HPt (histidine-containing phosphotransfer) domain-containing protein
MDADELKRQMAALSANHRRGLPAKLERIDALWQVLSSGAADIEAGGELLRALHTIAGSAKTFGMPAFGDAARAAENFFEPFCAGGAMPQATDREAFGHLLDALRQSTAG